MYLQIKNLDFVTFLNFRFRLHSTFGIIILSIPMNVEYLLSFLYNTNFKCL